MPPVITSIHPPLELKPSISLNPLRYSTRLAAQSFKMLS
jgi:hypothetical protein